MKVENFETDDIESAIQITPFSNETGLCDNKNSKVQDFGINSAEHSELDARL
jgi:hypothetical protein